MSKLYIVMSDLSNSDASFSIRRDHEREKSSKTFGIAKSRKSIDRYMVFHDLKTQRQTMIHLIFRQRLESDRADNIDILYNRIVKYKKTTLSYEKLSHRFKIFKKLQSMTLLKWIMKLIKTKDFLLQKLTYYKDTRVVEMRFLKKVIKLRTNIQNILIHLDRAFEERLKTRINVKFILLNYWNIDLRNGNIENSIFQCFFYYEKNIISSFEEYNLVNYLLHSLNVHFIQKNCQNLYIQTQIFHSAI